jgi:aminopeptidase N
MNSWVKQKGYPVVTLKSSKLHLDKDREETSIDVAQERFLIDSSLNKNQRKDEIGEMKWYIPLTYMTQDSDKEHVLWVNHTSRK